MLQEKEAGKKVALKVYNFLISNRPVLWRKYGHEAYLCVKYFGMENWKERTQLLLGEDAMHQLRNKHVLVVGLGGVGAYAAEMICRAGVGAMTIVDGDTVNPSNLNRQLIALNSSMGMSKANLMEKRLKDINPDLELHTFHEFLKDERTVEILQSQQFDYVVDAIDTLSPKVYLIYHAHQMGIPVISSMGAGGKKDPLALKCVDISKTYNCTLARTVRKRLRDLGIRKGIKTVFSTELVDPKAVKEVEGEAFKKSVLGTISFLPATFGCVLASQVLKDLLQE